jgi:conserved oligomeric Golgi complex subunit 6
MICEEVKKPENKYEAASTLLGSERPFGQVHLLWQIFGLEEEEGIETDHEEEEEEEESNGERKDSEGKDTDDEDDSEDDDDANSES